jgi:hypothetical protein
VRALLLGYGVLRDQPMDSTADFAAPDMMRGSSGSSDAARPPPVMDLLGLGGGSGSSGGSGGGAGGGSNGAAAAAAPAPCRLADVSAVAAARTAAAELAVLVADVMKVCDAYLTYCMIYSMDLVHLCGVEWARVLSHMPAWQCRLLRCWQRAPTTQRVCRHT